MTDPEHEHDDLLPEDVIYNVVVTDADAVSAFLTGEFHYTRRKWVLCQSIYLGGDSASYIERQTIKCFLDRGFE